MKKFKKVLIVNRGEIAVRIIQALRELAIPSVSIYSEADSDSYHRKLADYSVPLKGLTSAESYLNIDQIVNAIQISGADAVHPGYGFLSENVEFAKKIESLDNVTFIGPSSGSMRSMGDKISAKKLMKENGIPTTPGSEGALETLAQLESIAQQIGFPIILKAAAGGGGRGMQIVRGKSELEKAFETCQREAISYFGNKEVFAEKFIEKPRHIEIQILIDKYGNGVHLFERDCSIQRRHQKLIEEAPSTFLTSETRMELGSIALKAAQSVNYQGVGTVEFICQSLDQIFFMEMNTRIQVEHPVTEMVTGIDLVQKQIEVAMGMPLGLEQKDIPLLGHAVEARINAEDPKLNFAPCPGMISQFRAPTGAFVRVDSHIYEGYSIPEYYDSMIAKIICWGKDRGEAIRKLDRALSELYIKGITTNASFQKRILAHPTFLSGEHDTSFIEKNDSILKNKNPDDDSDKGFKEIVAASLMEFEFLYKNK